MASLTSSAVYEIRVRGILGDAVRGAFDVMVATSVDGDTVLSGSLPDRTALHAMLNRIDSLGLELVAVQRVR